MREARWGRVYAAMAATTAATLVAELALTRIFSVVLFYHFAFLAISVAMFGLGAGAMFSYYLTARRPGAPVWAWLGGLSAANAAATAGALVVVLRQPVTLEVNWENALRLALIYLASAVPFMVAGAVISLAVAETVERIDRVYFFDLAGASLGCLALVPLLDQVGGPNAVLSAGVLYAVAAALWHSAGGLRRRTWMSLALAGVAASFVVANVRTKWIDVRLAKGRSLGTEVYSRWNSFSRVGVKPDDGAGNPHILIDADAATSIPNFAPEDLDAEGRRLLLASGPGLPYRIRPGAKTLIIGPGGGFDVARALAGGSRDVTGVEINPIIVNEVMRGRFAAASHNLYLRPEVHIHVEDGRTFVRRSTDRYQVIQMTLVDTWASTAAGAFALSENNLYTTEAFADYLEDLTPDGLLSVTRWEFEPPRETLRVVSLARAALQGLGVAEPRLHVLVCREQAQDLTGYGAKDTVLVKRTPFTAQELDGARDAMAEAGLAAVYLPDERIPNAFTELLETADPERFVGQYRYDISPVSDNRPFFFYTVRTGELWDFVTGGKSEDVKLNLGMMVLFVLLGLSVAATGLLLLLPRAVLRMHLPREPAALAHLGYFFAIGLGFILVEVALIQKFVLFLGQPTYSLTVVVFTLLAASGLGSYASRRLIGEDDRRLGGLLATVAGLVVLLAVGAPRLLEAGVGWPLWWKCLATAALLAPAGFAMGMAFPSGLKRLEKRYPAAVRWAWAMNSAASVLGSVAAVFFAIHLGLAETLLLGGAAYVGAWGVVRGTG